MKLGISYIAFEGEELLQYAIQAIRDEVDFISVVYQDISFFGNPSPSTLVPTLKSLVQAGMIDKLVSYEQDLSLHNKINELNTRNLGLELSREAGCTHHISADVDEMYTAEQLRYAKCQMADHDCLVVNLLNYYKRPTWRIWKDQGHQVSFIHPVDVHYDIDVKFPFHIDVARKPHRFAKLKVLRKEAFVIHHMTFVRRNIRVKLENSPCWRLQDMDKFISDFDKYTLGDRLRFVPDQLNRKTVLVPDIFNIGENLWEHRQ